MSVRWAGLRPRSTRAHMWSGRTNARVPHTRSRFDIRVERCVLRSLLRDFPPPRPCSVSDTRRGGGLETCVSSVPFAFTPDGPFRSLAFDVELLIQYFILLREDSMPRKERVELIRAIEKSRKSKLITLITGDRPNVGAQLASEQVKVLERHLSQIVTGSTKKLDLFIYSRGGDADMPWSVVKLIRE